MMIPYLISIGHWLPKQHKTPVGSRFVVSGRKCTVKTLSKDISKALRTVQKSIKFKCNYDHKFSKTSAYWIINSSKQVHEHIENINTHSQAKYIYTGDFSTLYSLIPHDQLLMRIRLMLELGFNISKKKCLRINKNNATWRDKFPVNAKCTYMDLEALMESINILLENIYISFNNKVYRQKIGIPIGSDCAQELANLYLLSYELEYVDKLLDVGHEDSKYVKYNSRYIDDLISLNDMGYMERIYQDIYPIEMKLNQTNNTSTNANYLDINIQVIDGKYVTKIYDKRRDYNFKIVSLPHMSSNVPLGPTYGVFISQVQRFFVANNTLEGFYKEVKGLVFKLLHQGFIKNKLKYYMAKYLDKRFLEFTFKYWQVIDIEKCF